MPVLYLWLGRTLSHIRGGYHWLTDTVKLANQHISLILPRTDTDTNGQTFKA